MRCKSLLSMPQRCCRPSRGGCAHPWPLVTLHGLKNRSACRNFRVLSEVSRNSVSVGLQDLLALMKVREDIQGGCLCLRSTVKRD